MRGDGSEGRGERKLTGETVWTGAAECSGRPHMKTVWMQAASRVLPAQADVLVAMAFRRPGTESQVTSWKAPRRVL